MNQNTNNYQGKNLILISNPSDRFHDTDLPLFGPRMSSAYSQMGNLFNSNHSRQPSGSMNIFKTFNNQQKVKEQPVKIQQVPLTQAQKYAQQCLQYQKYQFDDKIKLIIHRMSIKAYQNFKQKSQHIFFSLSIQKLLSIVAKKLLLNRFELLFLQYVIQQTKWKYDNQFITKHMNEFNSYSQLSENDIQNCQHNLALKKLQIYLLFCGFYSKKSLNQFPSENIFYGYLKTLCNKFKDNFTQWTQNSNVLNIKINPKVLNNIFKRLTYYVGRQVQQIQNYCLLVEEIIQISPAYNAQKGGNTKKKGQKKIKTQQYSHHNNNIYMHNNHHNMPSNNIIQDMNQNLQSQQRSRFMGDNRHNNNDDDYSSVREQLPNLRNKKQTSYVSNVDGLDPEMYMREHSRMI